MPVVGNVIKTTAKYADKLAKFKRKDALILQQKQLKNLLSKAKNTEFGKEFGFADILKSDNLFDAYRHKVPVFDYDYMFKKFWHRTLSGNANVTWPGYINHFALTSGTTGASSKRIPVSNAMVQQIKKTGLQQFLGLSELNLSSKFYNGEVLFLGGSSSLEKINDKFEGDLSGIVTGNVPSWLTPFSKPEKNIRSLKNWSAKIDSIVAKAPDYDISIICGVPSWVELLIARIIQEYSLNSIFEIWPNLKLYFHGGVNFSPYMNHFNQLFEERVIYLDTYLASEGFFGYQHAQSSSMQLCLNNGIYFEFIPFNSTYFDSDGNLKNFDCGLTLNEISTDQDYALLVSTCSGAWRYLIGDTIRFENIDTLTFKITGRTKHFLSLCGEHLSVDNMNEAITSISISENIIVREFAVKGFTNEMGHGHTWYVGCDQPVNSEYLSILIDARLKELNDDYKTERSYALNQLKVKVIPSKMFYDFMDMKGIYGAQYKFPRVLKGKMAEDWDAYLSIYEPQKHPWFLIGE